MLEKVIKTVEPKINTQTLIKNLEKLEAEIHKLTENITKLEAQLADSGLYTVENVDKLEILQTEFAHKKAELHNKEEAWLEASEAAVCRGRPCFAGSRPFRVAASTLRRGRSLSVDRWWDW